MCPDEMRQIVRVKTLSLLHWLMRAVLALIAVDVIILVFYVLIISKDSTIDVQQTIARPRTHFSQQFIQPQLGVTETDDNRRPRVVSFREDTLLVREDPNSYLISTDHGPCLYRGLVHSAAYRHSNVCVCDIHWYGQYCSLPVALTNHSGLLRGSQLRLSEKTRRLISIVVIEDDVASLPWLRQHFDELETVVDAFILLWPGDHISTEWYDLHLALRFKRVVPKLRHVLLKHSLSRYNNNSNPNASTKLCDTEPSSYTSIVVERAVWKLAGLRADDVLMVTNSAWTPSKDLCVFLKLHHGYADRIALIQDALAPLTSQCPLATNQAFWFASSFSKYPGT